MKVSDFNFELPDELIAQKPIRPRDSARLLYVNHLGDLNGYTVKNLTNILKPGDLVVVNDTRVIPANLTGHVRGKKALIKVTLHKDEKFGIWRAFARPSKKLSINNTICFASNLYASVVSKLENGEIRLKFNLKDEQLSKALKQFGMMPLPPYIKRPNGNLKTDNTDYQTTFANCDGAIAAPTAGLHFTPSLVDKLKAKGIRFATLTLHVGAGTFLPIKVKNVDDHCMHSEWGEINSSCAEVINTTRNNGGRVIAIGTTTLRLLETAADADGKIKPFKGETCIFITPGYQFKVVDMLLSNFHLPKTTLFMLVSAFCGLNRIKTAYKFAIKEKYRFFSFGDTTLLEVNKKCHTAQNDQSKI